MVVFAAPQLSLYELCSLAEIRDWRKFKVPLLAVTGPQVAPNSKRFPPTANRWKSTAEHSLVQATVAIF
jgi:hypothetical protein